MKFSKKILFYTFGLSLFLASYQASAAPSCSAIYRSADAKPASEVWTRTPAYQGYQGELDLERLKRFGFTVSPSGELSIVDSQGSPQRRVGKVLVFRTPVVFQWADESYNQELRKAGKIDQAWMDTILAEPGQAAGKGFYVSVDPLDSTSYGTHLNTLKTNGPIILLEYDPNYGGVVMSDTAAVKKLASAGIDALRSQDYTPTWMSMISNRHLVLDSGRLLDVSRYLENQATSNPAVARVLQKVYSQLPAAELRKAKPNTYTRLLLGEKVSLQELKDFQGEVPSIESSRLATKVVERLFDFVLSAKTPDEMTAAIKVAAGFYLQSEVLDQTNTRFATKGLQSERAQVYRSVIDLYDLKTLSTYAEGHAIEDHISLETMKKQAARYQSELAKTDLSKIQTAKDLIAAAERIYGLKYKFRNHTVVMTDEFNPDSQAVEVTQGAYDILKRNSFLKIEESSEAPQIPGNKKIFIDYWTPELLKSISSTVIDGKLYQEIDGLLKKGVKSDDPEMKARMPKLMESLVDAILKTQSIKRAWFPESAFENYAQFMSLHPFKDGNGRMGRLLYQVLVAKQTQRSKAPSLNLPVYDMDLFIYSSLSSPHELTGLLLKAWVAQAKDDQDFLIRSRWALEMYFRAFPNARAQFSSFPAVN